MSSAKPSRRARSGGPSRRTGGKPVRPGAPRGRLLGPFRNLRVAQKLFVGFGLLSVVLIGVGGTAVYELDRANDRLETVYRENLKATAQLGDVRTDVQQLRALSAKLILKSPLAETSTVTEEIRRVDDAITSIWKLYAAADTPGTAGDRLAFTTALASYRDVRDKQLVPAGEANNLDSYLAAQSGTIDPLAARMTATLDSLAKIEDQAAARQMATARQEADTARTVILGLIGGGLLFAVVLSIAVSRAIAGPLGQTVKVLEALAEGRLDQRLDVHGHDEVGRMAEALNTALDRLTSAMRGINGNVSTLTSSSEELTAVAAQMNSSALRSADRAQAVSAASEQISFNISTVSAGADEIGSSITEIAQSTASAAEVAGRAVKISGDAGAILRKLGESSAEIVSVIKIITGIAEQTNLLALNATIEAARAGDAGKGFAVVAGEVKELAQETARATEDIRTRVGAIQIDSSAAVAAIAEIGAVIDQINATQTAIAAAVEEQTATTNEMGRNVGEVASGTQHIAANVAEVAGAASETTSAASNTARAADELAEIAHALQKSLAMFRY